jgi:hypothetical protein
MTEEKMRALVQKHMEMEANTDVEGTLETLVDHPVYEFYPLRLKLTGKENIRQFYQEHFDTFFPKIQLSEQISACWGPGSACLEYDLYFKLPLDPKRPYRIMIVLTEKDDLLLGERFFAEEELIRLMTGNLFDRLAKIQ